ncbi:MAG TPA: carboxyl transferase domain-containing protein, partial [Polyangiaceae bacterium]
MSDEQKLKETLARVDKGGAAKYHEKNAEQGKLFARERIARLVEPGSFVEDAALANNLDPELPADRVVTGTALIDG